MAQTFGIESSAGHAASHAHRPAVRYLVLLESAGAMVARMFLETRDAAGEFDASCEEVAGMTLGLAPERGAGGPEWDTALAGHDAKERAEARVYTLDL